MTRKLATVFSPVDDRLLPVEVISEHLGIDTDKRLNRYFCREVALILWPKKKL